MVKDDVQLLESRCGPIHHVHLPSAHTLAEFLQASISKEFSHLLQRKSLFDADAESIHALTATTHSTSAIFSKRIDQALMSGTAWHSPNHDIFSAVLPTHAAFALTLPDHQQPCFRIANSRYLANPESFPFSLVCGGSIR
jgi:hypothetical protein